MPKAGIHLHNDHDAEVARNKQRIRHELPPALFTAIQGKRDLGDPIKWTDKRLDAVVAHVSRLRVKRSVRDWYKKRQRKPITNRKHILIPHESETCIKVVLKEQTAGPGFRSYGYDRVCASDSSRLVLAETFIFLCVLCILVSDSRTRSV